jgi:hypothetical protein
VFVEQDVLELQVAVDARLVVDIQDGANELGEDALDLGGLEGALLQEVVVELVAGAVLEDQPDQLLGDYDLVQAGDVRVDELAVVVDLAREVGVVLLGRLEDDLLPSVRSRPTARAGEGVSTLEPLLSLCEAR